MVALPFPEALNDSVIAPFTVEDESENWVGMAAAGALVAGGILLITGNRRAGLVAAASGAALALIDQKEAVQAWWSALPGYIDHAQQILSQVQESLDEVSAQSDRLRKVLAK